MLSAVLGLLTFTIVSDGETERTLAILVHGMLGLGSPDALHVNNKLLPSNKVTLSGETDAHGASENGKEEGNIFLKINRKSKKFNALASLHHLDGIFVPSWLVSSVGRALHRYGPEFFFRSYFQLLVQ